MTGPVPRPSQPDLALSTANLMSCSSQPLCHPVKLKFHETTINTNALLDSGATANFISTSVLKQFNLIPVPVDTPIYLTLADGTRASVTHCLPQTIVETLPNNSSDLSTSCSTITLYVVDIRHSVILGLPWFSLVNPEIDWVHLRVKFPTFSSSSVPEVNSVATQIKLPDHVPSIYEEFTHVFYDPPEHPLPPERAFDLEINLKDTNLSPPYLPLYHLSIKEQKVLRSWIDENLSKGFIRPSRSPSAAPIFFVPKKDGSLRPCIDYRQLNANTIPDRHPLPLINQLLDRLSGARYFTSLDLKGAYNLLRIRPGHEWKAAFRCQYGHFEPLVVQFGLINAPAVFQRFINSIFLDLLDICMVVYLDDLLIFSSTLESHISHVKTVLSRLSENHLVLKPSKCSFHQSSTSFLGHIVSQSGVTMDPSKVEAIKNFPTPQSVTELRSFLGMANFYRRFIPSYSKISLPLTNLTKKSQIFEWNDTCDAAFATLKAALAQDVVLQHPDPSKPFHLATDASAFALGAVLSQEDSTNRLRPVGYYSRKFVGAELNYTVYDKELLAIISAFKHWRPYLVSTNYAIQVFSDHKNLSYFKTARYLKSRHARWSEFLSEFDFVLTHLPGSANVVADTLSRSPALLHEKEDKSVNREILESQDKQKIVLLPQTRWNLKNPLLLNAVSSKHEEWPDWIKFYLINDHWPESAVDPGTLEDELVNFKLRDNDLFRVVNKEWRLYIRFGLRNATIKRFHEGLGHLATKSILSLLERRFWWPTLQKDLQDYISRCPQCQLNRPQSAAIARSKQLPIRPVPSVALPFERIGMDFIQNLPCTKAGNQHIITAIDYATRWVIAKAVPDMSANTVVKFLYEEILMNFGAPFEIITDRGSSFLSQALKQFEDTQRIRHHASTPYHPQTNGMVERMHSMLGHAITTLSDAHPHRWDEFLAQAILALRVRTHSVTKFSPFYLLYGVQPRLPGDTHPPRECMEDLDELEKREARQEFTARTLDELGQARAAAYHRSLAQAEKMQRRGNIDPEASDHYFKEGEWVKLKHHAKTKFEFTWKGPYVVVKLGHPGTYWLMNTNGVWLDSTINQRDLAPWRATTKDNEDYFYDGTNRILTPPAPPPVRGNEKEDSVTLT